MRQKRNLISELNKLVKAAGKKNADIDGLNGQMDASLDIIIDNMDGEHYLDVISTDDPDSIESDLFLLVLNFLRGTLGTNSQEESSATS